MVQTRIPPPPDIAQKDPVLNRWLIELTNVLNGNAAIDPTTVAGLVALTAQVNTNTAAVTSLQNTVAGLQIQHILNGSGAPAAGSGIPGDIYIDYVGKHIWFNNAGVWVQIV